MLRLIALALLLTAAACTAPTTAPVDTAHIPSHNGKPLITADGEIDQSVVDALTADPAACTKAGGEVRPVCRMQKPMCVVAFTDVGTSCTDSSDCMGRCLADMGAAPASGPGVGKCAANNDPCGCFQTVEKGVLQPALCAD